MGDIISLLFFIFLLQALVPFLGRRILQFRRGIAIQSLERRRGSWVITLTHRQEAVSFLGVPIVRYIDIEDSLAGPPGDPDDPARDADRPRPPHPGGTDPGRGADRLSPQAPRGRVTVLVPHYAMSGGTLIVLAADEIVMDPNAVLGPVDPQLGTTQGHLPGPRASRPSRSWTPTATTRP